MTEMPQEEGGPGSFGALLRGEVVEGEGPRFRFSSDALLPSLEELLADPEGRLEVPSRRDLDSWFPADAPSEGHTRVDGMGCAPDQSRGALPAEAPAFGALLPRQVRQGPQAAKERQWGRPMETGHAHSSPLPDSLYLPVDAPASHSLSEQSNALPLNGLKMGAARNILHPSLSAAAALPHSSARGSDGGSWQGTPASQGFQQPNKSSRLQKKKLPGRSGRRGSLHVDTDTDDQDHVGYAIDPETGRHLQYGPAMVRRKLHANVPSVATLFKEMALPRRAASDRWKPNPTTPSPSWRQRPEKAKTQEAISPLRRAASMTKRWPIQDELSPAALIRSQSCGMSEGTASSGPSLAPQPPAAEASLQDPQGHGSLEGGGGTTAETGSLGKRARDDFEIRPAQPGDEAAGEGDTSGFAGAQQGDGALTQDGGPVPNPTGPVGQGEGGAQDVPPTVEPAYGSRRPARQGFGSIAQGVIRAAAATASSGQPPVRRLEELLQERTRLQPKRFKGVSRAPWSVTWDAHVTPGDGEERTFLGSFPTSDVAARAYDVASLHMRGSSADTNFTAEEYLADLEDMRDVSISEFIVAMQRFGAFGGDRQSRYLGVHRKSEAEWESRYTEDGNHNAASQ